MRHCNCHFSIFYFTACFGTKSRCCKVTLLFPPSPHNITGIVTLSASVHADYLEIDHGTMAQLESKHAALNQAVVRIQKEDVVHSQFKASAESYIAEVVARPCSVRYLVSRAVPAPPLPVPLVPPLCWGSRLYRMHCSLFQLRPISSPVLFTCRVRSFV